LRILQYLNFGTAFYSCFLKLIWNSSSNISCYSIIAAFIRIFLSLATNAFLRICLHYHSSLLQASGSKRACNEQYNHCNKGSLIPKRLSYWISRTDVHIILKVTAIRYFVYLFRCIPMFEVRKCENNNTTIQSEIPWRQNSNFRFSGAGREGVTLYLVILLKGVWIFNMNISIKSQVLMHQLH
jgi:hypothetical protein